MSDYGDDYSDDGEEFFYVEDEYMLADDLAEHAIGSPPPMTYDEDAGLDWDRFDYFNDLEYASDGYDDGKFSPHSSETRRTGEKRKLARARGHTKKRLKVEGYRTPRKDSGTPTLPPVVWRTQDERVPEVRLWDGSTESYALLKDWRERPADIPSWASGSPESDEVALAAKSKKNTVTLLEPLSPNSEYDSSGEEEEAGIDPAILMAALQDKLSAAGGPMTGIDPQQLLQYALRMMSNQDDGDDIAGELANALLQQGEGDEEEEEEEDAPANLPSWLDSYRQSNQDGQPVTPRSPEASLQNIRPPTPPSSEANRSIHAGQEIASRAQGKTMVVKQSGVSLEVEGVSTRKRKAEDDAVGAEAKRQATMSSNTLATASQPRDSPSAPARSARTKR